MISALSVGSIGIFKGEPFMSLPLAHLNNATCSDCDFYKGNGECSHAISCVLYGIDRKIELIYKRI